MTGDDRWDRIKQIFQDALEQPAEARRELVRWYAEGDEAIAEEVESLLAAHAEAQQADNLPRGDTRLGQRIGAYRITGEIGRGGMGAIYRAVRDDDAFRKEVAVKVIKRGMDTDAVVQRFRNERQILADLDHPNIARMLDGGTTKDGVPYFVMEYIDGVALDVYCEEQKLSIRERLEIMQAVCEAVDYAHQRGVVHRDLKPGNILLRRDGTPKLVDFGIAKLLTAAGDAPATATLAGHQILTPAYASPEQLGGKRVTPASDVYSLGVVLYEVLTGKRPFGAQTGSLDQIARIRQSTTPSRPSEALGKSSIENDAENEPDDDIEHRRRRRQLRGDLDDIVLMALDADPSRRYESAGELGRDIARHLAGEAVRARRQPRLMRMLRRYRGAVAIAAIVIATVAAVLLRNQTKPETPRAGASIHSIAVLPLTTEGRDTEHLGLGIADAIIIRLSDVPGLVVRPTSAIRQYAKQPRADGITIGRALRADAVLEGTLRRVGDRARVTVQLIAVEDAAPIWSGKFDQAMTDVLTFEDLISAEVARSLSRDIAGSGVARGTIDPQAYQSYLRGRYLWNQRTFDSFRNAIRYFEDAIRRDPNYAAAHAGIADCYLLLGWANAGPPKELFPLAKNAANRALELDDTLAEAHTSLAQIHFLYEWDFRSADARYRRAIELDPNYATARQWYALFLSTMHRDAEAIRQITLAQQADPVSRVINMNFAGTLAAAGRYDDAIAAYKHAIEIDPNFGNVWAALGSAYQSKGDYESALRAYEQARRLYDDKPSRLQELAIVHALMGHRERALAYLAEMKSLEGKLLVPAIKYAYVYAALGETDQVFQHLEQAYRERSSDLVNLDDGRLDALRDDPRYEDLMRRVGLPKRRG